MKTLSFLLFALAASAHADVVFDTFSPGDTYTDDGYVVYTEGGSSSVVANPFTLTQAATLDRVTLPLFGNTGRYTITLRQGGAVEPGVTVYSWAFDFPAAGITALAPTGRVDLAAGDYYIVAESNGVGGAWYYNDAFTGPVSYASDGNWSSFEGAPPAMRVEASPVPEPATLAALGLSVAAACRRRRQSP